MKIINVTRSYPDLVREQLRNTDAITLEVYSAGNTEVVFTQAPTHYELLINNKHRAIRADEHKEIEHFFFNKRIDQTKIDKTKISRIEESKFIEISIPIRN
ncbi:hypothetical protein Hs30E_07350 [Lactococcus hodotermopsidis]|uniref:Ribose-5-phosphate isomerase n=1 Tax=Pseudolactococcus hodotermopsidis TaxID=2709157 RepID=A0A6A0BCM9_9LACT|nr:DUF1827 family protein [Lactococcus hodotermopsidis]GFH42184.1 hypothetical protein Hs30E_07350 [Lactococcus hodotermopsidis]